MPKKRYNAEDIIHKLREAQVLIKQWRVYYKHHATAQLARLQATGSTDHATTAK